VSRLLLDSTVVIDLLRQRVGAHERLRSLQLAGDDVYVTAITAYEVTVGLRPRERDAASRLFEGLRTAPLGIGEGRLAGWWAQRYAARGRTLAQADLLIAAAAVGLGARLATANPKDFPMNDVPVEHWPSGG
jgi:predicted nucleic acid-binding protein